jgi:hypothetical protein
MMHEQRLLQVPEKFCCKLWEQQMPLWGRAAVRGGLFDGIVVRCWWLSAKGGVTSLMVREGNRRLFSDHTKWHQPPQ